MRDPSNGKATIRRIYAHECEACHSVNQYRPQDIERHQHGVQLALD
jgi:hypothetical protein